MWKYLKIDHVSVEIRCLIQLKIRKLKATFASPYVRDNYKCIREGWTAHCKIHNCEASAVAKRSFRFCECCKN